VAEAGKRGAIILGKKRETEEQGRSAVRGW
jgi:hypothetical protein